MTIIVINILLLIAVLLLNTLWDSLFILPIFKH